ncbi:MAG: polysaccharide deacetylase [Lachnospiraceae bacterium]|nr:polysaccharide deacetylase [Lachnospiraceae bacterium]
MAQSEGKKQPMSKEKRRFLRKIIIFFLVIATPVLTVLCIFLGIRLHIVRGELKRLQAQAVEASAFYQTGDLGEPETPGEANRTETDDMAESEGANGTGTANSTEEYADRYSADGVSVSKRDSTGLTTAHMGEEAVLEDGTVRKVYLTFDDGPSSNTARILDILAEYDVKATFFVVGKEEEKYQELYKRIVDEGHTLGMHSYSHKYDEIYQSVDSFAQDLSKLQEFLYETTGVWCRYCRFPGGSSNTVSRVDMFDLITYLDEQDITYFDWNVSSGDASNSYISEEAIINNCMLTLPQYQESIILMHDASNKNTTVEALPALIEQIQAMDNTVIVPITEDTEPIQHISSD